MYMPKKPEPHTYEKCGATVTETALTGGKGRKTYVLNYHYEAKGSKPEVEAFVKYMFNAFDPRGYSTSFGTPEEISPGVFRVTGTRAASCD